MSKMIEQLWRDDPITISDVAVTLGEMAESFDGGEYAVSDETRRALIDFAHGIPDHPLFVVFGHYFARNPVPGATQPAARRVTDEDVERAWAAYQNAKPRAFTNHERARLRAALESFAQPAEGVK